MANEKKYTAREAAVAVLSKVHEVMQKSELTKALNHANGKPAPHTDFPRIAMSEKMEKKYEGFKAVEESAKESGASNPAAVAASAGRKKYSKEAFQHAAAEGHKMGKAENPDEKEDAQLGEDVEH